MKLVLQIALGIIFAPILLVLIVVGLGTVPSLAIILSIAGVVAAMVVKRVSSSPRVKAWWTEFDTLKPPR